MNLENLFCGFTAFFLLLQGGIFAADNPYYGWMVPTIAHSIVINMINKLYRTIATLCTDFENHRCIL